MDWLRWHSGELLVVILLVVGATRVPLCGVAAVLAAVWVTVHEIRTRGRVPG